MNSHDLARMLLEHPDMKVSTHASNHTCRYTDKMQVRVVDDRIVVIGNFTMEHHLPSAELIMKDR
ncbi:MAG: hypothetical protein ACXABY_35755 [Candidatus Thorarchaeota archaeon]